MEKSTNKVFLRKTKRGKILKIVREHYLRNDIFCGSAACEVCPQMSHDKILSSCPPSPSSEFSFPHYIVPDTNVVLDQIDVLEESVLCDIVVPVIVLEEVKNKSSAVYKRLRELVSKSSRRIYTFVNEHHKDTFVERQAGESSNDRNDRAIRTAIEWYNGHLRLSQKGKTEEKRLKVILLTNDVENMRKSREMGITALTIEQYVKSLKSHPELQDKLAQKFSDIDGNKPDLFPLHLSPAQIHEGVRSGKLLQGSFVRSRENYLEGFVSVEEMDKSILLQGRESLNRAVDGDIVAVELFPEDKWSAPCGVIIQDDAEDPGDVLEDESGLLKTPKEIERVPTGRIVGIIRRKWRQYCGILQPSALPGAVRHLFVPAESKIPKIRIETRQAEKLARQRIIVAIDQWPRHSRYPLGHFVRALGALGDKETENEVILLEHDIPHSNFSEEVLSFLPKMPWGITEADLERRVDLRNVTICSVDPPGCTDIDDALHARRVSADRVEVGVHIADVSHFIKPGNAMDREAALRATTVYLVEKRIDMVPELLSSNLCSLRGGVERFAFSCVWQLDNEANVVETRFFKSVIRSKAALTYEEAQLIIDDKTKQDDLAESLRELNKLAKILKRRRIDKGALILASPQIRFLVDSETHDPIEVEAKKSLETNSMVEEFMLLANISVAQKIEREFPEFAMLRRHPEPSQTNLETLVKAGENQGFTINTNSGKELATSLDAAVKKDNPYFNTMLRIIATRCMNQALYFISGSVQKEEFFHYGLAVPIYTHFTSPIRRYADIIVHRLLAACIGADGTYAELLDKRASAELCKNLNYRNRMAQYAGRASVALNTHLFFKGKSQEEEGYVLLVRKNALQVIIPKFGLEGTIYVKDKAGRDKTSAHFTYDEHNCTLQSGSVIFHAFDPVTVRLSLDSSNVQHEKLLFDLVKPHIEGFSVATEKRKEAPTEAPPQQQQKKKARKERK
ncbi:exosome complex exonuclease RRP44 [Phlebotomus argentipes]|uniref:exosome complex exonuclease RRP44 n=1 Tax=Phlebotomus argentipes TaxID=94469 RepID=UPI002892E65F|nr:exosome complex exonuclease RRP44 [Phlebotomus argentipes]